MQAVSKVFKKVCLENMVIRREINSLLFQCNPCIEVGEITKMLEAHSECFSQISESCHLIRMSLRGHFESHMKDSNSLLEISNVSRGHWIVKPNGE